MSKYLERFKAMAETNSDSYELIGDCILVERLPKEEQKIGSLYMPSTLNAKNTYELDKPNFVTVLAVGKGYYDEATKEEHPLSVKPGDVILVSPLSVKWFSAFLGMADYASDTIGITRDSEIQLRFFGSDALAKVTETLSRFVQKPSV